MIVAAMNASSMLKGFPSPEAWKPLLLAKGPVIAAWVLGLAVAAQAAVLVTDLAGADAPAATEVGPVPVIPQATRLDIVSLVNAHLFGVAKVEAQGDASAAPQTSMPLVLAGVLANSDPQKGIALIGESASSAKVFTVGAMLPGGARLHSVFSDRVVIDRGGSLESLALPRQPRLAAASPPMPQAAAGGDNPILDRMRRMIADDPGIIGDVMRPQPVFAQGKQRGYRVYPGRNRAAFSKLGLRAGDLVTAINGTPLDDPARGNEIFGTIASASEARVTVMRNGRQQELTLNMAQVANEAQQITDQAQQTADQASTGGALPEPAEVVPPPNDAPVEPPATDND